MGENPGRNGKGKPVAVVIGATSKWLSDGRNTRLAHGKALDDSDLSRHPLGHRRRRCPEVRTRRVRRHPDETERGQCVGSGGGDPNEFCLDPGCSPASLMSSTRVRSSRNSARDLLLGKMLTQAHMCSEAESEVPIR